MSDSITITDVPEIRAEDVSEETTEHDTQNVSESPMAAAHSRVDQIKEDELNSSFYTSEEEGLSDHRVSDRDDADPTNEPEFQPPDDELRDRIIKQVEFYFSDANILKDAFLLKHVRRNKQGYVSIKLITSFKKMKSLTKDYRVVAYSLRQSELLEVNEEGKKVRRKDPLPEYDETTPSRSVVALNLPMETPSIENVAELFSKCGEVALIRILRPGKSVPQDVKKHSAKHPEIGTTVCAVVEFEKHESAKKACETLNNDDDWRKGMRVVLLAESKKKETKSSKDKEKQSNNIKDTTELSEEGKGDGKKRRKRGGRKNKKFDDDSSCYSSGSELEPTAQPQTGRTSLSPSHIDPNRLSPSSSPRNQRRDRRSGPHGVSPLADRSPGHSPRHSPRSSPELGRKKYDYSSGDGSTPSSPWVQRRIKAAQEKSMSPLAVSPAGSPMLGRRNHHLLDMGGVTRQPKGPDGTKGFHLGRGKPRASTFS